MQGISCKLKVRFSVTSTPRRPQRRKLGLLTTMSTTLTTALFLLTTPSTSLHQTTQRSPNSCTSNTARSAIIDRRKTILTVGSGLVHASTLPKAYAANNKVEAKSPYIANENQLDSSSITATRDPLSRFHQLADSQKTKSQPRTNVQCNQ
jgi:hypothetical protein